MIHIVAAVGKNQEIGKENRMLWNCPEDLKFFRELTLNNKIFMGRNTFESIGKPLDFRENYVISKTLKNIQGINIIDNIEYILLNYLNSDEIIYVIGGGSIYSQLIDYAEKIYISKIDEEYLDADTYFPKIDEKKYNKQEIIYNTFKLYIYTRRTNE
ncbi:dihydrofolate reductase [Streptobacillus felis]|uniref:dihydrofolate reductase n=1 Tax=Streptobacillus felis TaxID=1384509 RepID=A0A7Z0TBF1_9FUSO|nr:dihydrofolate reductase [Streptobacillus felis]NYV27308.1 dihydrofolate reductase [Streptobacillus felis]